MIPKNSMDASLQAIGGVQTCDLIIGTECLGDTVYCTGTLVENNVDSNKRSYYVKWANADSTKYAPPLCVTSIGNLIGEALWEGETNYSIFVNFLISDNSDGLKNALHYNGKTAQQTIEDMAKALGLSQNEVDRALAEAKAAGKDWTLDKPSPASTVSVGDVNGDGVIDISDATMIQMYIAKVIDSFE